MKVEIIKGPKTEENIAKCQEYLLKKYITEVLAKEKDDHNTPLDDSPNS